VTNQVKSVDAVSALRDEGVSLIPSWAAGRASEAIYASHPAPGSTSGRRLLLTRRLVFAIAHLSNPEIRVASAFAKSSKSESVGLDYRILFALSRASVSGAFQMRGS
jgi:hypothetical protein